VNGGGLVSLEMKVNGLPSAPLPPAPVRDEFDRALGPEWNYLRNPDASAYAVDGGRLVLKGSPITPGEAKSPTWVGRRQQHFGARASTELAFVPSRRGEEAGVSVYMNPTHRCELAIRLGPSGREAFVRQTVGPFISTETGVTPIPGTVPILLEVRATPLEYVFFAGSAPGALKEIGRAATRYLSSEVAGGFTGVYFGLYATGNGQASTVPAAFEYWEYEEVRD
jgi:alpha-N-arabinofuranosidase